MLKKFMKMWKCSHHFIPQYQLSAIGGTDRVYVSQCKCGRFQYKSLKRVLREGAAKKK